MRMSDLMQESLISLTANRLRSILAVLGIVMGVASVTIMLAIGEGGQMSVRKAIESLGSNIVVLALDSSKAPDMTKEIEFKESDGLALQQLDIVRAAAPLTSPAYEIIKGPKRSSAARVIGTSPSYFVVRDWKTTAGDVFTDAEVARNPRVAVIGANIAKNLFGKAEEALAGVITISNVPLTVVGVLAPKGRGVDGSDQDGVVVVPLNIAMQRVISNESNREIENFLVKFRSNISFAEASLTIENAMRAERKIPIEDDSPFVVRNPSDVAKSAMKTRKVMTMLLGSIAAISLLVGGIGIMNIMFVCVTERTREIGIRKSIGARKNTILLQFLMESVMMSLCGCIGGVIVGLIGIWVAENVFEVTTSLSMWPILLSSGSSLIVGVVFGYYPARKAAKMLPVESLRYQ